MKRAALVLIASSALAGGYAVADTKDLEQVHSQIEQAISALGKAQAAHHDELGGHAQKAGEYLNQAAHEVRAAIETAQGGGAKSPSKPTEKSP